MTQNTDLTPMRKTVGGVILSVGDFALSGIGLAALVGIVLNLLLPKTKTSG